MEGILLGVGAVALLVGLGTLVEGCRRLFRRLEPSSTGVREY